MVQVAAMLEDAGIDAIELSGGTLYSGRAYTKSFSNRHPRDRKGPGKGWKTWIPASAGMTTRALPQCFWTRSKNNDTIFALTVWESLGVQSRLNDWIKNRIEDCQFQEGRDYVVTLDPKNNLEEGVLGKEYRLTLAGAKHFGDTQKT
jgi:phage anti-repressor protein